MTEGSIVTAFFPLALATLAVICTEFDWGRLLYISPNALTTSRRPKRRTDVGAAPRMAREAGQVHSGAAT